MVVVGAGAAGLFTALVGAEQGARVALVSSSPLAQSASYWAQGGLAAAIAADDDVGLHVEDTLAAGRGTCRRDAVRILCEEAPARVRELEERGIPFDRAPDGTLQLSLEGGHNRRRIVHAGGSATGRHLTARLSELVAAHPRIDVHERSSALALWVDDGRCVGVVTEATAIPARATVLGTGGAAALWKRTTNPRGAIGSGLLLALEAGAALADLEFMQFHPTALQVEGELDGFLVTEAVRGEGALIVDSGGERFVDELAPRDEVARAIDARLRAGDEVFLDMRGIDTGRFPNIVEKLAQRGTRSPPRPDPGGARRSLHDRRGRDRRSRAARRSPGCTRSGSARAPACTGRTGWRRTRCPSASCSAAARRWRPWTSRLRAPGELPAARRSRARAHRGDAGCAVARRRTAARRRGARGADAAIRTRWRARSRGSALERRETRGCHLRADFPATDPALDSPALGPERLRRGLGDLGIAGWATSRARRSRFTSGMPVS